MCKNEVLKQLIVSMGRTAAPSAETVLSSFSKHSVVMNSCHEMEMNPIYLL